MVHSSPTPGTSPTPQDDAPDGARRAFVVDTSVLLSDPRAIGRFAEHDVVLPVVVITELEAKRHHAELGYFARSALRMLDDLRVRHGRLDAPIPVGDVGGTLRVELNHTDPAVLPAGFRLGDNDTRILSVAANLAAEGHDVTVVSRTCRCGSRRRPWACAPRSTGTSSPWTRAGRGWARSRSPTRRRRRSGSTSRSS